MQRIFVQVLLFLPQRNEIEDSHLIRMSVNPKNENGKLYEYKSWECILQRHVQNPIQVETTLTDKNDKGRIAPIFAVAR